jgi:hypothetical protein
VTGDTIDLREGRRVPTDERLEEALAAMFDATAFSTVPWDHPPVAPCWPDIPANRWRGFDPSDVKHDSDGLLDLTKDEIDPLRHMI